MQCFDTVRCMLVTSRRSLRCLEKENLVTERWNHLDVAHSSGIVLGSHLFLGNCVYTVNRTGERGDLFFTTHLLGSHSLLIELICVLNRNAFLRHLISPSLLLLLTVDVAYSNGQVGDYLLLGNMIYTVCLPLFVARYSSARHRFENPTPRSSQSIDTRFIPLHSFLSSTSSLWFVSKRG